jgi:hypothetical protein
MARALSEGAELTFEPLTVERAQALGRALDQVRAAAPLVLNLTNAVVMNLSANVLLALGASQNRCQNRCQALLGRARSRRLYREKLGDIWLVLRQNAGVEAQNGMQRM